MQLCFFYIHSFWPFFSFFNIKGYLVAVVNKYSLLYSTQVDKVVLPVLSGYKTEPLLRVEEFYCTFHFFSTPFCFVEYLSHQNI